MYRASSKPARLVSSKMTMLVSSNWRGFEQLRIKNVELTMSEDTACLGLYKLRKMRGFGCSRALPYRRAELFVSDIP